MRIDLDQEGKGEGGNVAVIAKIWAKIWANVWANVWVWVVWTKEK